MPRIYTGPGIPAVYDPTWQTFTNLTASQILAFQSFPEDLVIYAKTKRWLAQQSGTTAVTSQGSIPIITTDQSQSLPLIIGMRQALDDGLITQAQFFDANGVSWTLNASDAKIVHQAVVGFIQGLFAQAATVVNGINAKTITSRAQIDAALAAVAPNMLNG